MDLTPPRKNQLSSFNSPLIIAEEKITSFPYHPLSYYGTQIKTLGQGAYGEVHLHQKVEDETTDTTGNESPMILRSSPRALNRSPNKPITSLYAIKWQNVNDNTIMELTIFKATNHPNILGLRDLIFQNSKKIGMVLKYADLGDLSSVLRESKCPSHLSIIYQFLSGMSYLHANQIYHRDLKPQNILVSRNPNEPCQVKIADFGLSTFLQCSRSSVDPDRNLVTIWYRPPETILGGIFVEKSDMFSVGCVIYEILTGKVFARGSGEIDQLFVIFQKLGKPDETTWPGVSQLGYLNAIPDWKPQSSDSLYPDLDPKWRLVLESLLINNPKSRKKAIEILGFPVFREASGIRNPSNEFPSRSCYTNLVLRKPESIVTDRYPSDYCHIITIKNWINEIRTHSSLTVDTYILGIQLFDILLNKIKIPKPRWEIYAITCLILASYLKEIHVHDEKIIQLTEGIMEKDIRDAMTRIIRALNADLFLSTPLDFINVSECPNEIIRLARAFLPLSMFFIPHEDLEIIANFSLMASAKVLKTEIPKRYHLEDYPELENVIIENYDKLMINRPTQKFRSINDEIKERSGMKIKEFLMKI